MKAMILTPESKQELKSLLQVDLVDIVYLLVIFKKKTSMLM